MPRKSFRFNLEGLNAIKIVLSTDKTVRTSWWPREIRQMRETQSNKDGYVLIDRWKVLFKTAQKLIIIFHRKQKIQFFPANTERWFSIKIIAISVVNCRLIASLYRNIRKFTITMLMDENGGTSFYTEHILATEQIEKNK